MGEVGHEMYSAPEGREWILKWFHGGRLESFANFIGDESGICLSVGCGTGIFETEYIDGRFDEIYALDPTRRKLKEIDKGEVIPLQSAVPPIPFSENVLDVIVASGVVEHLPDEQGFIRDSLCCLKPGGRLYLTTPIEVGIGGLIRHLGRCYTSPDQHVIPDGPIRYLDYTLEELQKNVPREKNSLAHRYYNYTYLLTDVRKWYKDIVIRGWPIGITKLPNLILFVKARAPNER